MAKYDTQICIRLNKRQREILELIAEYHGLSVSDVIRYLINDLIISFHLGIPKRLLSDRDVEALLRREGEEE